ncbi:PknB-like serine/threonine protein kinase [Synechococcus phage S-CBWM1]|uniref:PknB-like serine/threonine protein kinase n=1 Tax=Synechococcus phage S-CBWM1 TaxID=2053653 RepID=A0A3G1L3V0_9CAUD|nr:PknB-like serine/threonine protein kinase [Synechococcus phage S-CBWM1]ATW62857.1 PknB-like serine/threonine protein kinase [Synechococcus phage S-CBWM1]
MATYSARETMTMMQDSLDNGEIESFLDLLESELPIEVFSGNFKVGDFREFFRDGKFLGSGSFSRTIKHRDVAVKFGFLGTGELHCLRVGGEKGFSPKLHGAIISTQKYEDFDAEDEFGMEFFPGVIAMELCEPITEIEINNISEFRRKLWKALESSHRCGISHRDLYERNVARTVSGEAVLLDFGLAEWSTEKVVAEILNIAHSEDCECDDYLFLSGAANQAAVRVQENAETLHKLVSRISGMLEGQSKDWVQEVANLGPRDLGDMGEDTSWKPTEGQCCEIIAHMYNGVPA